MYTIQLGNLTSKHQSTRNKVAKSDPPGVEEGASFNLIWFLPFKIWQFSLKVLFLINSSQLLPLFNGAAKSEVIGGGRHRQFDCKFIIHQVLHPSACNASCHKGRLQKKTKKNRENVGIFPVGDRSLPPVWEPHVCEKTN